MAGLGSINGFGKWMPTWEIYGISFLTGRSLPPEVGWTLAALISGTRPSPGACEDLVTGSAFLAARCPLRGEPRLEALPRKNRKGDLGFWKGCGLHVFPYLSLGAARRPDHPLTRVARSLAAPCNWSVTPRFHSRRLEWSEHTSCMSKVAESEATKRPSAQMRTLNA